MKKVKIKLTYAQFESLLNKIEVATVSNIKSNSPQLRLVVATLMVLLVKLNIRFASFRTSYTISFTAPEAMALLVFHIEYDQEPATNNIVFLETVSIIHKAYA